MTDEVETSAFPAHIAVIMDGNGRWANARGLSRSDGHKAGVQALQDLVGNAKELGVKYLTVFAFSSENWQRPKSEVKTLMNLLRKYLKEEKKKAVNPENNIKYIFIGDLDKLDGDIRTQIQDIEEQTNNNNGLYLIVAISYGGKDEIVNAARNLAFAVKQGRLTPADINEKVFAEYLYCPEVPYPDLLIRTSGEKRISNFLLWQTAYTEMVFTNTLWPDFSMKDLKSAIKEFQTRVRRYGKIE